MTAARPPGWTLAALTAAVLAAHLMVLRGVPAEIRQSSRSSPRPLITRTVLLESAAPVMPAVAAAARPAALHARPRAAPVRATPTHVGAVQAASADAAPAPPPRAQLLAATAAPPAEPAAALVAAGETPASSAPGTAPAPTPAAAPGLAPASSPAREAAPPMAFRLPASVRLHYKVEAQSRQIPWQAEGELRWRQDGRSYQADLEVRAPFLPKRTQHSTGSITAQGLAPLRFADKGRNEEAAHFERDQGKVSFSNNRPDAALSAGGQDRLSVMLQLGAMIAAAPQKFPPSTSIAIQTASTRDAETWLFTVGGRETLQLPGGTLQALKLTRNPRKEFDQRVELWLAPSMDYVPVRLRLTQPNGDWVDQQWSSTDRG
jgi:hypothetical protein